MQTKLLRLAFSKGPIGLDEIESNLGLEAYASLEDLIDSGDMVQTLSGNFAVSKKVVKVGRHVVLPRGVVGVIAAVDGNRVVVTPQVYLHHEAAANFNNAWWSLSSVRVILSEGEEQEVWKNYTVTIPGYPSMTTEAPTRLKAITNTVARLMEESSNKKIVFHNEWYGEPQFGNLVNRLKPQLEKLMVCSLRTG